MLTDSVKNDNRPKGKHFIGSIIESILRMNASINRNIIINEIWYNDQSCIPQCPSDATFNEHGEFKKINEQDMHYFDAFKYNSHDEIGSLINTCA